MSELRYCGYCDNEVEFTTFSQKVSRSMRVELMVLTDITGWMAKMARTEMMVIKVCLFDPFV